MLPQEERGEDAKPSTKKQKMTREPHSDHKPASASGHMGASPVGGRFRHYWKGQGRLDLIIALVAVLVIGAIWAATFERLKHEREAAIADAQRQASNLVLALEAHTIRTFKGVDHVLAQVVREFRRAGRGLDIGELVKQGSIDASLFHNIVVNDDRGYPVVTLHEMGAISNFDRDYFQVHRHSASAGTYIGKPSIGRGTGKWTIHFSRRINRVDGSFGGVAFVALDPGYFTAIYHQSDLGDSGLVALVGLDGISRARHASGMVSFGQDVSNSSMLVEQSKAPNGSFLSIGRQEGIPRYVSYRTLADYPIVVEVGVSQEAALSSFRVRERYYYLGSALATLFMLLFAATLIPLLNRQRHAMEKIALSEASLRRSETSLKEAQRVANLGSWEMEIVRPGIEGNPLHCSEQVFRIFGHEPGAIEATPERCLRQIHPDDRDAVGQALRAAAVSGTGFDSEHRIVQADGSERTVRAHAIAIKDPASGKPLRLLGTIQDITELTRAQETLRESERRFRSMMDNVQMVSLMLDREGRIAYCNDYLLSLTGWRREEVLGRSWFELFVPPELPDIKVTFAALLQDMPEAWHYVNEILTRPGERRLIQWHNTVLRSASGDVVGTASLGEDITERRRVESEVAELQTRLQTAISGGNVGLWDWDLVSGKVFYSAVWKAQLGYSDSELGDELLTWEKLVHPDDLRGAHAAIERCLREPAAKFQSEFRMKHKSGAWKWILSQGTIDRNAEGLPLRLVGCHIDITGRKQVEEEQRLSAKVLASIADGVVVTDAAGRIVSVNDSFTRLTGYTPEEAIGHTPAILHSGRQDAAFYEKMWHQIDKAGQWQGEIWNRRKNGEIYPELLSVSTVHNGGGAISNYVGVFNDISAFKQYEERLHHLAHYDALTGLPNRDLFRERFGDALGRARRHGCLVAILFLDLDHFKNINDSLGHYAGDLLLQEVGKRLSAHIREIDMVARFGGDEFAVLLDSIEEHQSASTVARKLIEVLAQPFEIAGHQLYTSASIGIGCYPQDGARVEDLLKNADTAMYRAKNEGRNNYQFFSAEMNARMLENLLMTNSLRRALERDEFELHYQPRQDLATGRISGAEALIRWRHPDLGLVAPGRFIPLAEESGLIEPIGDWVLKTACLQMRAWRDSGVPVERVAVNLSARQFRHPDLAKRIAAILEETRLPARHLEVEVTESMVMQSPESTAAVLAQIKAMGISIAIDDFGTGYSSLSYLKRFPIDFLKIDQSFVRGVPQDTDDAAIVKTIIAMAKSLKLQIIAEGVETAEQRAFLQAHGCDEGQGYLFSRPVAASELEAVIARPREPRGNGRNTSEKRTYRASSIR